MNMKLRKERDGTKRMRRRRVRGEGVTGNQIKGEIVDISSMNEQRRSAGYYLA